MLLAYHFKNIYCTPITEVTMMNALVELSLAWALVWVSKGSASLSKNIINILLILNNHSQPLLFVQTSSNSNIEI